MKAAFAALQIFGSDPGYMARAAKLALEISGCDFVDINMGCPMPKIANSGDGAGLMKSPELAAEIVQAVAESVKVPVTVKMRKGWDKGSINCVELAQIVEKAGAANHDRWTDKGSAIFRSSRLGYHSRCRSCRCMSRLLQTGTVACAEDAVRILRYTGARSCHDRKSRIWRSFYFSSGPCGNKRRASVGIANTG